MFYHVIIQAQKLNFPLQEYDIASREELLKTILIPYVNENPFVFKDSVLKRDEVSSLEIFSSDQRIDLLVAKLRNNPRFKSFHALIDRESIFRKNKMYEALENVTEQLTKEAWEAVYSKNMNGSWGEMDIEGDDLESSITRAHEDDELDKIYSTSSIKVEKGFYTAYELKRKYDKKPSLVILDSDFQRKSVWTLQQKRELIESVLMGLPLPIFYFNEDKKGRLIVIDGRQRLSTLFDFMSEKNDENGSKDSGFSLNNLKILSKYNKKSFSSLDPILQTKIEDFQIVAHVIQPPTPDRIKFDIFDRVNRGGTQLNKQEIRNALYQGNATKLLYELSQEKTFEIATEGVFLKDKRMKDRYILLRFIAFYLYFAKKIKKDGKLYTYTADIDELLGIVMEYLNLITVEEIHKLKQITINALENTSFYLGEGAFRLLPKDGKKYPININIFENIMLAMTTFPSNDLSKVNAIVNAFNSMKESTEFKQLIYSSRDSEAKVTARYNMAMGITGKIRFGDV